MKQEKTEEIKKTMANIYTQIAERENKNTKISNITYYSEFAFNSSGFIENDIFVTKIEKESEKGTQEFYEIYNNQGNLIATTDENGKIHFSPELIEKLRQEYEQYFEMLNLDDAELELPEKLQEKDILLEKEQIEEVASKQEKDKQEIDQEEPKNEEQEIAKKKGIPVNNVLKVRANSNLYKDHPEIEKDLIFSRDSDGIVRAEYIDNDGNLQPSKYIMPSSTGLRQETISIGSDGNPVTKEVPQQVMQTINLTGRDKDVRDVRFNVKFDTYGYMDIEEARQGKNGQWAAHDVEVMGRNYNSSRVNEETSIRTGEADPNKETKNYSSVEKTGLIQDGVQYEEMYLIQHSNEIIEEFIKEGYQKEEAVKIFNYMIGEETLTKEQAKEKVDNEIREKEEILPEEEREEENEGRTPWGDAEARNARR